MSYNIGTLILAAGCSLRLGQPKQLLKIKGNTLIERTVGLSMKITDKVNVIIGSKEDQITNALNDCPVEVLVNKNWQKGMGSSLKYGVKNIIAKHSNLDGILVMVTDQPWLNHSVLLKMIDAFQGDKSIVACKYEKSYGVPVLFGKSFFDDLMLIGDSQGAKVLLSQFDYSLIDFLEGDVDIDTPQDWQAYLASQKE